MPLSQTEYLWSGATPLLLISPARFFLYKGPKIDYFLTPPLDYRLLFNLVSKMLLWGAWPESDAEASHVEKFAAEMRGSHKTIAGFPPV